jgi:hypothetical protein
MDEKPDHSWKGALREYVHLLAESGWFVIVSLILGEMIPIALFFWALHAAPKPDGSAPILWLTLCACLVGMLVPPFFAFMKMRADLLKRIDSKNAEAALTKSERDKLQRQLDDKRPRLTGTITECFTSKFSADVTFLTVFLKITNSGEPSIADDWRVSAVLNDGTTLIGTLETIANVILVQPRPPSLMRIPNSLRSPNEQKHMTATDGIVSKAKTAIGRGEMTEGYLWATFPVGREILASAGTVITVSFSDTIGSRISCSSTTDSSEPEQEIANAPSESEARRIMGTELSDLIRETRDLLPGHGGRNINHQYPAFQSDFDVLLRDEERWVSKVEKWLMEKMPHREAGFRHAGSIIINKDLDRYLGEHWQGQYKEFMLRIEQRIGYLKDIAKTFD